MSETFTTAVAGVIPNNHPRLEKLRQDVASLPISEEYRSRLNASIDRYADQIIVRPPDDPPTPGYADDLAALQQVALADWHEENLRHLFDDLDKGIAQSTTKEGQT